MSKEDVMLKLDTKDILAEGKEFADFSDECRYELETMLSRLGDLTSTKDLAISISFGVIGKRAKKLDGSTYHRALSLLIDVTQLPSVFMTVKYKFDFGKSEYAWDKSCSGEWEGVYFTAMEEFVLYKALLLGQKDRLLPQAINKIRSRIHSTFLIGDV